MESAHPVQESLLEFFILNNRRGDNSRKIAMNKTNCALITMYMYKTIIQMKKIPERFLVTIISGISSHGKNH